MNVYEYTEQLKIAYLQGKLPKGLKPQGTSLVKEGDKRTAEEIMASWGSFYYGFPTKGGEDNGER